MYVALPPAPVPPSSRPAQTFPLRLARIVNRRFDSANGFSAPGVRILADLAAAYRVPWDPRRYATGTRTTFTEMVQALATEMSSVDSPIGLVVLAHGLADAEPQWPACYLAGVLPGGPLCFSVADHGVVTPFLALRIAAEYIRAGGLSGAAVVALDQESLLRDPGLLEDAPVPTENRAVAMVFGRTGDLGELSVSVEPDVDAAAAAAILGAPTDAEALVVGGQLTRAQPIAGGVRAPAGLSCTGPWAALADGVDRWRAAGVHRIHLADYDPRLRVLARATVELSAVAPLVAGGTRTARPEMRP